MLFIGNKFHILSIYSGALRIFAFFAVSIFLVSSLFVSQARSDTDVFLGAGAILPWSVSVSDDGRYGTTASNGTVIVWDLRAEKMVRRLQADKLAAIGPASISPDGTLVATRTSDGSVALWDTANGNLLRTAEGKGLNSYLGRVRFASDGKYFFIESENFAAYETETLRQIYYGESLQVLSFSSDETLLVDNIGHISRLSPTGEISDYGQTSYMSLLEEARRASGYQYADFIGIHRGLPYFSVGPRGSDASYMSGVEEGLFAYMQGGSLHLTSIEVGGASAPTTRNIHDLRDGLVTSKGYAVDLDTGRVLPVGTPIPAKYTWWHSTSAASSNGRFVIFAAEEEITVIDRQAAGPRNSFRTGRELVIPQLSRRTGDSVPVVYGPFEARKMAVLNLYSMAYNTCDLPGSFGFVRGADAAVFGSKAMGISCGDIVLRDVLVGNEHADSIFPGAYSGGVLIQPESLPAARPEYFWHEGNPHTLSVVPRGFREATTYLGTDGSATQLLSPGPFYVTEAQQRGSLIFAKDTGGNLFAAQTETGEILFRIGDCSTASVQQELAARGHNPGPADGAAGRRTYEAIRALIAQYSTDFSEVEDAMLVEVACTILGFHGGEGRNVKFSVSEDGSMLAYASSSRTIKVVALPEKEVMWEAPATDAVSALIFTEDRRHLLYGTHGGTVVKVETATGSIVSSTSGFMDLVYEISFHSDRPEHFYAVAGHNYLYVADHQKGEILLTAIFGAKGEWAALTPAGYFASNGGGEEMLQVSAGITPMTLGNAFDVLSRPDLVASRMAGDGAYQEAARTLDLDTLFEANLPPVLDRPRVGSVSPDGEVQVTVDMETGSGGVGQVMWSVNGSVQAITDIVGASRPGSYEAHTTLMLPDGESVIEAKATNRAGSIESNPVSLRVSASVETRESVMHVAVIGVNDYEDPRFKLNFAAPDARAVAEAFSELGRALHADVRVHMLLDRDVTRDGISGLFSRLAPQVKPNDVFVLFMAGHGVTEEGKYHFLPADFRYRDSSSIAREAIGQADLQRWLSSIPAGKSLVMLDSCESGTLTEIEFAMRGLTGASAIEKLNRAMGRNIIAAASATQEALEGYNGHGVFTWSLLEAASDADLDGDGIVDIAEAIQFLDRRVPDLAMQAFGMVQVPQVRMQGGNFPLLKAGIAPAITQAGEFIPSRNTHVVVLPATVHSGPDLSSPTGEVLAPGTRVGVIGGAGGTALLSRDGRRVGYVAADAVVGLN